MKIRINKKYLIYFIALEIIVVFPEFKKLVCAFLVICNIYNYMHEHKEIAIICTSILPGEVFPLIGALLLLLCELTNSKQKAKNRGISKYIVYFLLFFSMISLINAIYYSTIPNLIFSMVYLCIIFCIIYYQMGSLRPGMLVDSIIAFIYIEAALIITQMIWLGTCGPNDANRGSFSDAHWFGSWIIVSILTIYSVYRCKGVASIHRKRFYFMVVLTILMLYYCDAKALALCGVLAVIIEILLKIISSKNFLLIATLSISIGVVMSVFLFAGGFGEEYLRQHFYEGYIYVFNDLYNQKFLYFKNTIFNELSGIRMFFGYGLGSYGSRFANLFAYNSIYRGDGFINNFASSFFNEHVIEEYIRNVKYYDLDFVLQTEWRSAILSYPYNSFLALLGECGWTGVLWIAIMANKVFKQSLNKIVFVYFFAACIFDVYFNIFPCLFYPLILMINIRKVNYQENKGFTKLNLIRALN